MIEGESSRANEKKIDELVYCMSRELNYQWSLSDTIGSQAYVIYKVPQIIRELDRNAYAPIILSIGPYHHGTPDLLAMEKEKWYCLHYILNLNPEKNLQDYVNVIVGLVNQARSYYAEEVKMEDDKFVQMLLVDGSFILVSLYGMDGIGLPLSEEYGGNANSQEIVEEDRKGQIQNKTYESLSIEKRTTEGAQAMKGGQANKDTSLLEVELTPCEASQRNNENDKTEEKVHKQCQDNSDQVGPWYTYFVAHDLLLLENQLPFFIIKKIYELVASKDGTTPSVADKIAKHVEIMLRHYPKAIQESDRPKEFHHLLHLCHMYFRPSQKVDKENQHKSKPQFLCRFLHLSLRYFKLSNWLKEDYRNLLRNQQSDSPQSGQKRWRRAVHYYEAGIEFERREFDKQNPHSLLDIKFGLKFGHGVMEIPRLSIDANTVSLFRNFIAFEQTCPQVGNEITTYVVFMSQLLSMPDDVTLLAQRGIILHQLRSDKDVSTLFTKLSKDVVFDFNANYYLKSLSQMMEAHYQSRLNRWIAWLRHNHFSNPWLALGALAAAIMLFCTVIQTLIAVFSYTNPPVDDS
ncbi:UPF0481 protein At3g47200-like [Ananas comosus]|uniref:UPF0481 protein At3g47200-like n=1 Tax=Ananas comosus TaxID=4615 RepID=A0A6P5FST1_ANACO|nr:UPF0481 protein At3g47200-like [Ananas comosus]